MEASKKSLPNGRSKAHAILERTHLSRAQLMKIIDAYADWKPIAETGQSSGVSHVTVGRVYNLIRQRLLDIGVYQSAQSYLEARYRQEAEDDGDGELFIPGEWEARLIAFMGRYRGISAAKRHLYEAEAVYRLQWPENTPAEIKTYYLQSIQRLGPLSASVDPALAETLMFEVRMERLMLYATKQMRAAGNLLLRLHRESPERDEE